MLAVVAMSVIVDIDDVVHAVTSGGEDEALQGGICSKMKQKNFKLNSYSK